MRRKGGEGNKGERREEESDNTRVDSSWEDRYGQKDERQRKEGQEIEERHVM